VPARPALNTAVRQKEIIGAIALPVVVLLAIAGGWLIAGRLLRPLRTITATARDISATDLSRGLSLRGRDDEFAELGGDARRPVRAAGGRVRVAAALRWPMPRTSCAPRSPRSGFSPEKLLWHGDTLTRHGRTRPVPVIRLAREILCSPSDAGKVVKRPVGATADEIPASCRKPSRVRGQGSVQLGTGTAKGSGRPSARTACTSSKPC
jgi:hypothetical protein